MVFLNNQTGEVKAGVDYLSALIEAGDKYGIPLRDMSLETIQKNAVKIHRRLFRRAL